MADQYTESVIDMAEAAGESIILLFLRKIYTMKLEKILAIIFACLFVNSAYAVSDGAHACTKALEKGDLVSADKFATQALEVSQNDRDALVCQGRAQSVQGHLNLALKAFEAADKLSVAPYDKTVIALVTGHAYKTAKQPEQAINHYENCIAQSQRAKVKAFERTARREIANIHFDAGQYQDALAQYNSAGALDGNDNERGESYESIALLHHLLNQHVIAAENQVKAVFMYEKAGTLDQYAYASIELGRYYTASKDYMSAEKTLNRIIKLAKEQGGAYYEAKGSYMLALVKAAKNDMQSAKDLIAYAKQIAKATQDNELADEIIKETQQLSAAP